MLSKLAYAVMDDFEPSWSHFETDMSSISQHDSFEPMSDTRPPAASSIAVDAGLTRSDHQGPAAENLNERALTKLL